MLSTGRMCVRQMFAGIYNKNSIAIKFFKLIKGFRIILKPLKLLFQLFQKNEIKILFREAF